MNIAEQFRLTLEHANLVTQDQDLGAFGRIWPGETRWPQVKGAWMGRFPGLCQRHLPVAASDAASAAACRKLRMASRCTAGTWLAIALIRAW